MYYRTISFWKEPTKIVRNSSEPCTVITDKSQWAKVPDMTKRMMYFFFFCYVHDDILTKVDRASMAVSLEVRVPLLDHRVVEFAWKVPLTMKTNNGQGKWLLRQVLYQYVPKELIERPKMGFGVPIDIWLRGPLRDWAESLIDKSRLQQEGYFNYEPIRE
jgi:asparagine synthase (glutamine-hydrolysing)